MAYNCMLGMYSQMLNSRGLAAGAIMLEVPRRQPICMNGIRWSFNEFYIG